MMTTWRRLLTPVAVTAAAVGASLAAPQASALQPAAESATGKVFSGRAASYEPGLGACGENDDPTDPVVALNSAQFRGSCGKTVVIRYGGRAVTGQVKDRCPRCGVHGLDISPVLFRELTGRPSGKINVKWSFD